MGRLIFLLEQFRMASGSDQCEFGLGKFVEQQPVGLNMAVPMPDPVAAQRMGATADWQGFLFLKQVDDRLQFVEVPALSADPLQVPLKRSGCEEREGHYTFSRSSRKDL